MITKYMNGDVVAHCPDCKTHTTFEHKEHGNEFQTIIVNRNHTYQNRSFSRILYRLLRCASCNVLGQFFPISVENAKLPSDAPKDIISEFREAELCAASNANRAASALFRSVLEKTLKANGYLKGTLAAKIDQAADDGVLTESRRKRAHNEIRVLGNDVLHDEWREVSSDDVEAARHYSQRILEDFYDDRDSVTPILIDHKRIVPDSPNSAE
jgi:hypothetical protein